MALLFCCLAWTQLVAAGTGRTKSPAEARASLAGFDEVVSRELKEWNTPGLAITIVSDGQVIYARGFGLRDLEKQLPVTTNTLFAIGSTSKAFTTVVMGMLVGEGKLDWDKPVRQYLTDFRLYDALQHRSNYRKHRELI